MPTLHDKFKSPLTSALTGIYLFLIAPSGRAPATARHAVNPCKQEPAARFAAGRFCHKRTHGPKARAAAHFCHVRFLWRFDFKRFRRLCLFIFNRRFFFRLPMEFGWWLRAGPCGGFADL